MSLKNNFGWLALTLGLVFSLILMWFSPLQPAARVTMPLLMALFMAELGFFVTAAGAFFTIKKYLSEKSDKRAVPIAIGNLLLAVNLLYTGYVLWPSNGIL